MTNVGTLNVKINANVGHFVDSMGRVRDSLGRFVAGAKRAESGVKGSFFSMQGAVSRLSVAMRGLRSAMASIGGVARRIGSHFQSIGMGAAAAAAPLVFLGKRIASMSGEFERAMVRVGAVSQSTTEEQHGMAKAARDLARTTEHTATQVSQGYEKLGLAGFKAREIIEAMPSVAQLASAGNLEMAESASVAASIMRSQHLETRDLARVNDVLVSAFTGANIVLGDVANAFKFVGSVSKAAGYELEETTAAIAKMADVGVPAEIAGTGLRGIILKLLSPTKKASKIFDELGITALRISKGRLPTLIEIIEQLEVALQDLGGDTDVLAGKLGQAFEQRAGSALISLLGVGSEKLREFKQRLKESGGVAEEIAKKQLNTFDGRMKILKSQVEDLGLTIGQELMPIIDRLAGGISGAVGWFQKLNPEVRKTIVEFAAFTTGAFASLAAISAMLFVLSPLTKTLSLVGSVIGKVFTGPALAAAAAVVGIIGLSGAFASAWEKDLGGAKTEWTNFVDAIEKTKWGETLLQQMRTAFDWLLGKIDFLLGKLGDIKDALNDNDKIIVEGLSPDGRTISRSELDAPSRSERMKGKNWQGIKDDLALTMKGAAEGFKESFASGIELFKGALGSAGSFALDKIEGLLGTDTVGQIGALFDTLKGSLADLIKSIQSGSIGISEVKKIPPVVDGAVTRFTKINAITDKFHRKAAGFTKVLIDVQKAFRPIGSFFEGLAKKTGKVAKALGLVPTFHDEEGKFTGLQGGSILDNVPVLANVTQGAATGAQAGGVWGGIIGAIIGLITSSAQFAELMEFLNTRLQKLADVIGMVMEGLEPVFGAFSSITTIIMEVLGPILKQVGDAFKGLAPLLMVIGQIVEVIAIMWTSFGASMQVLASIIEVVSRILYQVISAIMFILMPILKVIATVHNAIMTVLREVFEALSKIPLVGKLFKGLAKSFDDSIIDIKALDDSMKQFGDQAKDFSDTHYDAAEDAAQKLYDMGSAAESVSESLKNVPEGFKVALARFNAQDAEDPNERFASDGTSQGGGGDSGTASTGSTTSGQSSGGGSGGGGGAGHGNPGSVRAFATGGLVMRPTMGLVGEAGPEAVIPLSRLAGLGGESTTYHIEHMEVVADDPEEFARKMREAGQREALKRNGVAARGAPRFAGR